MSDWIDVTMPVSSGMVHWPGDAEISIAQKQVDVDGTLVHLTSISMSAHTGTHMDAPLHFVSTGKPMDSWSAEATVGAVRVIEITNPKAIYKAELEQHFLQEGERILFRTACSKTNWVRQPFSEDYVYIALDAAQYLVERKVRTVGVDYLSVGGFHEDNAATHVTLLSAGVWVIEGLDLSAIEAGNYEMMCLPLKLAGADGSPARVLLKRLI